MKQASKCLSWLLVLALVLTMVPRVRAQAQPLAPAAEPVAQEAAVQAAPRAAASQQHPEKEEIAAKWATVTQAASLYDQAPAVAAPYAPGKLSADFLESGITYLNYVRFVADLPEVSLDDGLCEDAQYGAVLLAAEDNFSHYPPQPEDMEDDFYDRGLSATSSSNISARWGYAPLTSLQSAVQGCMDDSGDNNLATVGHRRWLLNPTLGKVGFGYAQSAAEWSYIVTPVFDRSGSGCDYDFIAWPVSGNQPTHLFGTENPWSITLNPQVYQRPAADDLDITITRVSDGKQWHFDAATGQPTTHTAPYMIVNTGGYGVSNCIIFHPGSANVDRYEGVYQVHVSGIRYTDGTAAELDYQVDFFDVDDVCTAHSYGSVVTAPTCTEQGFTTHTCTRCGHSYVDSYTEALGHDYDSGSCTRCGTADPDAPAVVAEGWSGSTLWTLTKDGLLTVYGQGNMRNYGFGTGQPWLGHGVDITRVVIEEGVTGVGSGAFKDITTLESVTLPANGLNRIGEAAFYGCSSLKEITIPAGVYTIWAYTFKGCTALKSVMLPRTLIKLDQGAFENCTALTEIFIPGNTDIIGPWAFKGCTGLVKADMTWADATEIRAGAFKNCTALTAIILPAGIRTFRDSCFYGIGASAFTVPDTVTTIEGWVFARSGLKTITFQGSAPAMGDGVFNKIALTAYYPGGNATWTADVMQNYGGTVTWTAA